MSEEVFNMNFYGADELINALEKMAKEYPDAAGDLLRERGLELRRKIVLSAHENTNTKGDSKRSLGKIGSYRQKSQNNSLTTQKGILPCLST